MALTSTQKDIKISRIQSHINSGWKPLIYDDYVNGKWTYKTVNHNQLEHTVFLRHALTGKTYKWNQTKRITMHEIEID